MSVTLGSITAEDGHSRQTIDIHNFVSIKAEGRWRRYGTFEVKTYIITTDFESINMDVFRDICEVE